MGTVSRVHTFSSGAILTAAQLNNEFDNLLTSSAINGGLDATNLGVTAGQATASKALVVDSSRNLADGTAGNRINNLALSGTLESTGLITATAGITSGSNIVSDTDSTDDLGTTSVRWRNLYVDDVTVTNNVSIGGTLTLTGGLTLNGNVAIGDSASDTLTVNSTITSNLIFTDATYDIGASGATRPRDLHLSRNALMGGTLGVTGLLTATAGVTSGSNIVSDTDSTDDLGTTSVRWANLYVDSIGDTGQALAITAGSNNVNVTAGTLALTGAQTISSTLGVGTQSPQRPLHVDGTEGVARFTSTASGNNGLEVGIGTSSQAFVWQAENSYLQFATNNVERLRILADGTAFFYGAEASFGADTNNRGIVNYGSNVLALSTVQSGATYYDTVKITDGKVGIGISPTVKIHASGSSTNSALRLDESNSSASSYLGYIDTSGNFGIDINGGGYLRFAVGSAERVKFSANGDFAVDTDTLFVDATNDRVGINNTCSTVANFIVKASMNGIHAQKIENTSGQSIQETYIDGSGNGALALRNASGFQRVQLSTYENSYITAGYNFGLGTSSPSAPLEVVSSTTNGNALFLTSAASGTEGSAIRAKGAYTVADGADITFNIPGNGTMILVSDNNTGDGAMYYATYKSATVTLIADPNGQYATTPTSNKTSLFKSANSLTVSLSNDTGGSRSYTILKITASD